MKNKQLLTHFQGLFLPVTKPDCITQRSEKWLQNGLEIAAKFRREGIVFLRKLLRLDKFCRGEILIGEAFISANDPEVQGKVTSVILRLYIRLIH
jgi:hypothetical protein